MNLLTIIKRVYKHFTTPVFLKVSYLEPRKVVLITTRSDGKDNLFPLDWHTPLSLHPQRYAISVWKTNNSLEFIQASNIFVVNFMSAQFDRHVFRAGSLHGNHSDKFAELGFHKKECEKVPCCYVAESFGRIECVVEQSIDVGDHVLFIGNVLSSGLQSAKSEFEMYHTTIPMETQLEP